MYISGINDISGFRSPVSPIYIFEAAVYTSNALSTCKFVKKKNTNWATNERVRTRSGGPRPGIYLEESVRLCEMSPAGSLHPRSNQGD